MQERRATLSSTSKMSLSQPQWLALFTATTLVGMIGWMEYLFGWEYSLFVFYALPIVLVIWKTDRNLGFAFAFLCAAIWWTVHIENHPYQSHLGLVIAVFSRLFYFFIVVIATATVKNEQLLNLAHIENLKRIQELERDVLWTCEQEQQRIGRDLHDSLGPHLAAIGYATTLLANELQQRNQPEALKAEQIHELVNDAAVLLRNLIQGIFPIQMDGLGLSVALEELAANTSRQSEMSVTFCEIGDGLVDDPAVVLHLYRIVQEALNNAAKHGHCKNVTVALNKTQGSIRLAIIDDGQGIIASSASRQGIGLSSMRYRAQALGGNLTIESKPMEGTMVSCDIPIDRSLMTTKPA